MIGLVLGGGGAKGAYQAGAWSALHEITAETHEGNAKHIYSAADRITGIIGASVGALNAALLATCPAQEVEEVWRNMTAMDFYAPESVSHLLLRTVLLNPILNALLVLINGLPFSQKGLEKILDRHAKFWNQTRAVYAVCTPVKHPTTIRVFNLQEHPFELRKQIVLASAAMPILYHGLIGKRVEGEYYYDGGLVPKYNVPTEQMQSLGYKRTVTVRCSRVPDIPAPTAEHIEIAPSSEKIGGFLDGTLRVDPEKIRSDISLGYADTMALRPAIEAMLRADLLDSAAG